VPPPPPEVPPPPPDEEKYKHINMGVWMRIDGTLANEPPSKKMNKLGGSGELELHFSNQMRKYLQWTANFVASYDRDTIDGAADSGKGTVGILDLIA